MMLAADDIDVLRATLQQVSSMQAEAAAMFYDRLFELDPAARRLFLGDMGAQGAKMMSMLGAIVARLHELDALVPMVQDLARRHVAYGVRPEHYQVLGQALLWMLSTALGARFTPEVAQAWARAYEALSAVMLQAAYGAPDS